MPDHASLLSELGIGAMTYTTPEDHRYSLAIRGGFLEIHNNVVRVLTDIAEKGQEIDVTQAEKDLKHAQDEIVNPALGRGHRRGADRRPPCAGAHRRGTQSEQQRRIAVRSASRRSLESN